MARATSAAANAAVLPQRIAVWVVSQKGGIGKTTFLRALRALARSHGVSVAAYDGEGDEGQFTQYEGVRDEQNRLLTEDGRVAVEQDPLVGALPFDVKNPRQRDLVASLSGVAYDTVLLDLPGGTLDQIQMMAGGQENVRDIVAGWREAGFRVVIAMPIGPLMFSVRSVAKAMDNFGPDAEYLAIKNLAFADRDDFALWDGFVDDAGVARHGRTRARLLEMGGREMEMPALNPRTYALLDEVSLPFDRALDDASIPLADRTRIRGFLKQMRAALPDDLREAFAPLPAPAAEGAIRT